MYVVRFWVKDGFMGLEADVPQFIGGMRNRMEAYAAKKFLSEMFPSASDFKIISYDTYVDECHKYGITPTPDYLRGE